MINPTHLLCVPVIILLAQIPGCHFYIDAVPHIILSSEPLETRIITENHANPTQTIPLPAQIPLTKQGTTP